MRTRTVDERDAGAPATTQPVAEPGGQFEPAGAAADDDDTMLGQGVLRDSGNIIGGTVIIPHNSAMPIECRLEVQIWKI